MRTVHGQITGEDGAIIENGVIVIGLDINGEFISTGSGVTTDTNGEYWFTFVPTPNALIEISANGYKPRLIDPNFAPLHPEKPWNLVLDLKVVPVPVGVEPVQSGMKLNGEFWIGILILVWIGWLLLNTKKG